MKKIIVFIVLAILSMVTAAVSFVANDIGSYRHWIAENKPAIMENFDHKDRHIRPDEERRMMDERHDKDFKGPPPDLHGRDDRRDVKDADKAAKNAPAQDQKPAPDQKPAAENAPEAAPQN